MLDRSPDEMGSHENDMDELCGSDSDLDDDANETTTDGERIIYPWMKKIHVAGVGKLFPLKLLFAKQINSRYLFRILCVVILKWFFSLKNVFHRTKGYFSVKTIKFVSYRHIACGSKEC